jgi:hypothetical protein
MSSQNWGETNRPRNQATSATHLRFELRLRNKNIPEVGLERLRSWNCHDISVQELVQAELIRLHLPDDLWTDFFYLSQIVMSWEEA